MDETPNNHLRLVDNGHAITPRLKSIHTATGIPVSGLNPTDYPLYALCLECDEVITCRNFLADWVHLA